MKYVLQFCLQLPFETVFAPTDIYQVTLEVSRDAPLGLYVKFPLSLSDFTQNLGVCQRILVIFHNAVFHENPPVGSYVLTRRI
jgi:hypothetical protein